MKFLVTASLALWGAMLVSGCDGGAGPATPSNPFGTDPSGSRSEPTGASKETPSSSGQTTAQLCATVCAHIEASCPSYVSTDCAGGCSQALSAIPNCAAEVQAFLSCAASAQITCSGQEVEFPSCASSQAILAACESSGTGTTTTGGVQ